MATIKDVAIEAKVSVGTVSNVLNKKNHVKKEKEERVLAAMEKLGFHYNLTAKTLRTQKSNDIGLILPNITNPYYPEVARGVEDAAQKQGFSTFLCNTDRSEDKERGYIKSLLAKNVRGLIIMKHQLREEELLQLCKSVPVVLVDEDPTKGDASGIMYINNSDYEGIRSAVEYLRSNGHKRIGFIHGLNDSYSSFCRYQGFIDYCQEHNLELYADYISNGNYSMEGGYLATERMLGCPKLPTAILAANDLMAIGSMKAIQKKGCKVPDDISVMGYDDISFADIVTPALTTIHQPTYELGMESVALLLGPAPPGKRKAKLGDNRLIVRDSVRERIR